ncbi:MAG: carbohydrate ABC transporter permease [Halanaerobiales bacterium]
MFKKMYSHLVNLSVRQKKAMVGFTFVIPFLIGFAVFFGIPFLQSITFSLSKISLSGEGYSLDFVGLQNYYRVIFVDANFVPNFIKEFSRTVVNIPSIIFFSFFAAMLLNGDYKGCWLARVIFFLPVIMGAGVLRELEQTDYLTELMQTGAAAEEIGGVSALSGPALRNFLFRLKLPAFLIEYIITAVQNIPNIIRDSGVQILIFLAGLQSISNDLYEASKIEGATGWESFWMITFPLLTPLMITNVVYTIIDSFTSVENELVDYIQDTAFGGMGYGVSTAMSWLYFTMIALVLIVVIVVLGRRAQYMD